MSGIRSHIYFPVCAIEINGIISFQALNEEIVNRKKNVDQAIKNGQALLKQTTGTLKSISLSTSVVTLPYTGKLAFCTTLSTFEKLSIH